jgi:hypothetical protein
VVEHPSRVVVFLFLICSAMQPLEMESLVVAASDAPPSPTLSSSRRRRRSSVASAIFSSAAGACLENDRNERMHGGGAGAYTSSSSPSNSGSSPTMNGLSLRRTFSFAVLMARGRIRTLLIAVGVLVIVAMLSNMLVSTEMSVLLDEVDEDGRGTRGDHIAHAQGSTHPEQFISPGAPTPSPISDDASTVLGPTQPQQTQGESDATSSAWNQDGSSGTDNGDGTLLPPPELMDNATHIFMSRWCDVNPSSWFPSGHKAWQLRAPYVLLPGAKHSGVEELARALQYLHPTQVVLARPESLGQFYPQRFRTVKRGGDKTHVALARARMYARDYTTLQAAAAAASDSASAASSGAASVTANTTSGSHQQQPTATAARLVGVDYTSGYMFYPPTRILCVMPWIRLVVVVRKNPVDRVVAHYREAKMQRKYRGTIEAWLRDEWTALRDAGLVNASSWKKNLTVLENAWYRYQQNPREGAIGRSVYEVQLRHWLEAMRVVGHDVSRDVMIVYAEDLVAKPEPVLRQISAFLGLPEDEANPISAKSKSLVALLQPLKLDSASAAMSNQTRNELKAFFEPFQRRLKQLIKTYNIRTTSSAAPKSKGDG